MSVRRFFPPQLLFAGLLLIAPARLAGDDKIPAERCVNDRQIIDLLASIHDRGATLFNAGDPGGAYRFFEGSLRTIQPLLPKELRDMITMGLPDAENQPAMARRALLLHELIEAIRVKLRATAGPAGAPLPPPRPVTPGAPKGGEPRKEGELKPADKPKGAPTAEAPPSVFPTLGRPTKGIAPPGETPEPTLIGPKDDAKPLAPAPAPGAKADDRPAATPPIVIGAPEETKTIPSLPPIGGIKLDDSKPGLAPPPVVSPKDDLKPVPLSEPPARPKDEKKPEPVPLPGPAPGAKDAIGSITLPEPPPAPKIEKKSAPATPARPTAAGKEDKLLVIPPPPLTKPKEEAKPIPAPPTPPAKDDKSGVPPIVIPIPDGK